MSEKKSHVCEDTRLHAERLLELMRKRGPRRSIVNAIARELADREEMLLARAVIRIERELAAALTNATLDTFSPFADIVIALDRRSLFIAREQCGSVPVKTQRRTRRKTKHG